MSVMTREWARAVAERGYNAKFSDPTYFCFFHFHLSTKKEFALQTWPPQGSSHALAPEMIVTPDYHIVKSQVRLKYWIFV